MVPLKTVNAEEEGERLAFSKDIMWVSMVLAGQQFDFMPAAKACAIPAVTLFPLS